LRLEEEAVGSLVHTLMPESAVISVGTEPRDERLVIAYPDEKTSHDFLASPGILAADCRSREEAQAGIDHCTTTASPSRRRLTPRFVAYSMLSLRKFVSGPLLANDNLSLVKTQGVFCDLLQHVFVAAVVVFYSKNVLSTAVRALISL